MSEEKNINLDKTLIKELSKQITNSIKRLDKERNDYYELANKKIIEVIANIYKKLNNEQKQIIKENLKEILERIIKILEVDA
jgi:hemerythrin-like domain-containing protein